MGCIGYGIQCKCSHGCDSDNDGLQHISYEKKSQLQPRRVNNPLVSTVLDWSNKAQNEN